MLTLIKNILVYFGQMTMLYFMFEWKLERRKTLKIMVGSGAALCLFFVLLTERRNVNGILLLLFLIICEIIIQWCLALYKGLRFWFTALLSLAASGCIGLSGMCGLSLLGADQNFVINLAVLCCFYAAALFFCFKMGASYRTSLSVNGIVWSRFLPAAAWLFGTTLFLFMEGSIEQNKTFSTLSLLLCVTVLFGCAGLCKWVVAAGLFYNVSEKNQTMQDELSRQCIYYDLAYADSLTGLRNRRAFDEDLKQLIERRADFYYAFFDVNGLKEVNDLQGHARGDELLKTVAATLKVQGQEAFFVYRLGGDEFAYLSYGEKDKAAAILTTLEQRQVEERMKGACPLFAMGYGYKEANVEENSVQLFLERVERKMYVNKADMKHDVP